ncbi:hypothetical protein T492DRAFT_865513 [Pavlovales sp. CCMP2436]|nr:hypothetical protein T492DRAFT_865513 [Pavlovales sp. CCMP2436]
MDGEASRASTHREPTHDITGSRKASEAIARSNRLLIDQPQEGADFSDEAALLLDMTMPQFSKLGRKFSGAFCSPDKVAATIRERDAAVAEFDRSSRQEAYWSLLVSDFAQAGMIGSFFNPAKVQQTRRDAVDAAPHLADADKGTYFLPSLALLARPLQLALCGADFEMRKYAEEAVPHARGLSMASQGALVGGTAEQRALLLEAASHKRASGNQTRWTPDQDRKFGQAYESIGGTSGESNIC